MDQLTAPTWDRSPVQTRRDDGGPSHLGPSNAENGEVGGWCPDSKGDLGTNPLPGRDQERP